MSFKTPNRNNKLPYLCNEDLLSLIRANQILLQQLGEDIVILVNEVNKLKNGDNQ